jgi:HD-GYP domain-containing protein (c-di-GMP phosphodiesterase class II)
MILQHHERLDGSGYPNGLHDDAIGIGARILAVADTVESMYAHRPYRPALGIDAALHAINKGRAKRYDPEVVDACTRLFTQHRFAFAS